MRFNYKKISAIATSVLLTGLTVSAASAVSNPADLDNPAVVYGAESDDSTSATGLGNYISENTEDDTSSSGAGDESVSIEDGELYLGEALDETFDDRDLENLLAEQTLVDDEDDVSDIDYATEIVVDNSGVEFDELDEKEYYVHSDKAEDTLPVLHINLDSGSTYSVNTDFYTTVNFTDYEDSETITIAGKELVINPNLEDENSDILSFYESSETVTIESGDSKTVDGKEIEVTGGVIGDQKANLVIDGSSYSGLQAGDEKDGVYLKDVAASDVGDTSTLQVEVMVGSAEWKIDSADLEIDGEDVDGVNVNWGGNHEAVDEIKFEVTPSNMDEDYLEELLGIDADDDPEDKVQKLEIGGEFIDPIFGFGMFFEGSEPEVGEGDPDLEFSAGSEELTIDFTNRNGVEYSIEPYEYGTDGNVSIQEDWFVSGTSVLEGLEEDNLFIIGSDTAEDEVTYIYKVDDLNAKDEDEGKDEITLVNVGDSSTRTYREGDEIEDSGLDISAIYEDAGTEKFNITNISSGASASVQNKIVTEDEVGITLTDLTSATRDLEATTTDITLEEDRDGELEEDNTYGGETMNVTVTSDTGTDEELQISSVAYEETQNAAISDSDSDVEYYVSQLGTYTELDEDDDAWFNVWSPEEHVEYEVSIANLEDGDSSSDSGSVVLKDNEDYSGRDVIIVGGSCINSAAADVLTNGEALCGDDFTSETNVKDGEFILKGSEDDDGNVVVVAAGYRKADTTRAVELIQDEDFDEDLSSVDKIYTVSDAEEITEAE